VTRKIVSEMTYNGMLNPTIYHTIKVIERNRRCCQSKRSYWWSI